MPARRAATARKPRTQPTAHNGIDAFGTLKTVTGEMIRARLIEHAPNEFAAFPAGGADPIQFTAESYTVKGRLLTVQLDDGGELQFQKAGCGCETPRELRGARTPLLQRAGIA
jgi:hypothetical protein